MKKTKAELEAENERLREALKRQMVASRPKPSIFAAITVDLWPPRDWLRLSVSPWEPGRYFQVCVGPFRLDISE